MENETSGNSNDTIKLDAIAHIRLNEYLKDIDIDAEFVLITQKKSKLSANMRRMVVIAYADKLGALNDPNIIKGGSDGK